MSDQNSEMKTPTLVNVKKIHICLVSALTNQTYRLCWTGLSTFPEDRASLGKTCACSRWRAGQAAHSGYMGNAMPEPDYYAIAELAQTFLRLSLF